MNYINEINNQNIDSNNNINLNNKYNQNTKKGIIITKTKICIFILLTILISFCIGIGTYFVIYNLSNQGVVKKDLSGNYLSSEEVIKDCAQSIVVIETTTPLGEGAGSGVIVTKDGYILTNQHVIDQAKAVKVTSQDGTSYDAQVIEENARKDLALIKINPQNKNKLQPATLGNPNDVEIGETAIVIGNPLGLGISASQGIISATGRNVDSQMEYFQIDAAVNPGNSGGGLFNFKGELIGIVNMKLAGESIDGIGFAIPLDEATKYLEKANADISGLTKEEGEEEKTQESK